MVRKNISIMVLVLVIISLQAPSFAQSLEFPNNFTRPQTVPSGCLLFMPGLFEPPATVFFDETFSVDGFIGTTTVRIQVWRIGCHEPGRSAIALNLLVPESPITGLQKPFAFLQPQGASSPVAATLSLFSGEAVPSALQSQGGPIAAIANTQFFPDGATFIVQGINSITAADYNSQIDLILDFGLNLSGQSQQLTIPVSEYLPLLDPPQLPLAPFHGRYSGQWVVDGLPASGLLLQIGEVPGTDRNFVFAIWFTYIDGVPTWVVGNTDFEIGSNEIDLDMSSIEGGEFFTQPGSFTRDDIVASPVGTMTIRANHCNEIEADVDFTAFGEGTANLTFNRLIRIAGYDCDQTQ